MEFFAAKFFFSLVLSFLFTLYLVPIFIAIAYKFNIVDRPDGVIKRHTQATPYLGGVAVYLGFLLTLGIVFPFDSKFFLLLIGSTILLYVGLIDDLIQLRPSQKFFGQMIATFCFLRAGFYLKEHFFFQAWNIPLSAFWILTVINACNLIDIMDGLCATTAIGASFGFLALALIFHNNHAAILLSSLVGALLAFLYFNKPKAQVYLGDAGSLFVGGFLATIPFLFQWGSMNQYGCLIPLIILAVPLIEVTSLILLRTCKKRPFYCATNDHFTHYLKKRGFSEKKIIFFILTCSLILVVSSISFSLGVIELKGVVFLAVGFLLFWAQSVFGVLKK